MYAWFKNLQHKTFVITFVNKLTVIRLFCTISNTIISNVFSGRKRCCCFSKILKLSLQIGETNIYEENYTNIASIKTKNTQNKLKTTT